MIAKSTLAKTKQPLNYQVISTTNLIPFQTFHCGVKEWCKYTCTNCSISNAARKIQLTVLQELDRLSLYPPHDFGTILIFPIFWLLFWVLFDINVITCSDADGGPRWVLTTDRRRPCHRWGYSETHPPSAPHWPALATSHWAAHVWTRTAPSEGKGRGLWIEPNEDKWGKTTNKSRWGLYPSWRLRDR